MAQIIPLRVILSFLVFLLSFPVSAGITEGIQYLSSQVQQDASYDNGSGIATTYQNTSEVLNSFFITNQNQPQEIASALQFLQNQPFQNTEYLSRLIIAQAQHSQVDTVAVSQLKNVQNQNSGFGEFNGFDSSVLDTAIALEALAVAGESANQTLGSSVSFLLSKQNADGGWSEGINNSNVYTTAIVLNALSYYQHLYSMDVVISSTQSFLFAQTINDLWPETYQSALSLIALVNTLNDLTPIANNIAALRALQQTNGSWDNDVYSTALSLRALHLSSITPVNSKLASLSGTIIDGQTSTGLNNVTVTLSGPSQKTVLTTQQGDFNFQDLIPGNYSLSINVNGFSSVTADTVLNPGQKVDFGRIQLLPSGTVNQVTIRGVITDAETNLPIPGVSVNLQNHSSVITDTSGIYQFSQVPPSVVVITATINGYSKATGMSDMNSGGLFVFSPSLTLVTQPVTAIKGQVLDADTGLPLSNVIIKVSVTTAATTTTDSSGQYLLANLQPGDVMIEASLPGYQSVSATGILYQDNVLLFSPALQPVSASTGQNNTGATGIVVDADTLLPLENVTVDAYYGLSYSGPTKVTVQTDDTGQFTLMGITESPVNFIFSLSGYSSSAANLTVEPFTIADLGEIQLQQQVVQPPLPDLIINNVDNTTTLNDPVTLKLSGFIGTEISNAGTEIAPAGTEIIAFYDSNQNQIYDPISDTLLGQVQTASQIQPNEKQQLTIPVQGILPYRDALIHVWIDSAQTVIESDESNNLLSSAAICNKKSFTILPPPPDITVAPGYSLELYATKVIKQQGPIQLAIDSADNLYFAPGDSGAAYVFPKGTPGPANQRKPLHFGDIKTTDTDGVVVDSQDNVIVSGNRILKFAPDETLIWSRSCPAGNIQLSGIDQNDAIYVGSLGSTMCKFSAEGDRQILGPFPAPHSPNFAPDGTLYLNGVRPPNISTVNPDTGEILDFFLINFFANQLAFDCDGFIYTSQINDPSGIRHIYKIDPVTKQLTSLASGIGFINPNGFVIDSEGNLFIADQTAKKIYKLTFAESSCRPGNVDLTASKLELNGILSNSNTFSALIGNGGSAATPATIARLYEGDPANGGILVGTLNIPAIAADSSLQITFNNISLAGGQDLYVSIDDDQQINECREDNNIARLAAPDLKPDLIVSAFDTTAVNTDLFSLAVMGSLDATITNQGTLASQSATTVLAFYDKDKNGVFDPANEISLGQVDILNSLQIGESQTYTIPINGSSPFRDAPITLWVDHLRQIAELDENNNTQITSSQCITPSGQVSSDLTVSLAQIIDNGSLQPWSFSARIANAGSLSTPDQIKVSFYEGLPSQGGILLGSKTISAIKPGNFINLQLDGITHFSNTAELYVIADENNQLNECDETNNVLLGAISAASLAQIIVSTDQPSYPANTPVLFQSIVTNAGSATSQFNAQLELEDSAGVIIEQFASIQTGTLIGGASFSFNQAWNTETFLTGTYRLRGSAYAIDGSLLDQSTTTFAIVGASGNTLEASLRTTTDQAQYHTTATVQIQNLIQNLTPNRIIDQAVLDISVTNSSGQVVFTETVNTGQMLPGASQSIIRPFSFIAAPVGVYTVDGVLTDATNNQLLATDQTQFSVFENLLFSISGTTQVAIAELERGQLNHCTDTLINQGSLNLTNLPVRQLVANISEGESVSQNDLTLNLATHVTQTLQRDIDTQDFSAGIYACIIQVQINGQWKTLANDTFILNIPPINIEAQLGPGDRGRLLVLIDDENKHCNGYSQITLETTLFTPLTANSTVIATLYDTTGNIVDQETGLWNSGLIDLQSGNNDVNLIIEPNTATKIRVSVNTTTILGNGYRLLIETVNGNQIETYQGNLIPTDCSETLVIATDYADTRLIDLIPATPANDPLGTNHRPDLTTQRQVLEHLLTQAGWSYTLVNNKQDFTRELRSGSYLTYLLLSEQIKLDETVQKELREAIYRGEGLVEAGSHDQRQGRIDAALGLKFRGKHAHMDGFRLKLNPLTSQGEADFQLNDRTLRTTLDGATELGTFIDQGSVTSETAITHYDYGLGRSVYIGFDLAAEAALVNADPLFASLLLEALDIVHPLHLSAQSQSTYPIRLSLNNLGISTPGQAIMSLPQSVSILDSGLAAVKGQTLIWPFDLAEPDQLILDAWLRLPALPLQISTLIQTGTAPDWTDQATLILDITPDALVTVDSVSVQANAITDKAYKQVKKYLGWAQQDNDAGQWQDALSHLLRASDALITIDTPESKVLRIEVAKAIRSVSINLN